MNKKIYSALLARRLQDGKIYYVESEQYGCWYTTACWAVKDSEDKPVMPKQDAQINMGVDQWIDTFTKTEGYRKAALKHIVRQGRDWLCLLEDATEGNYAYIDKRYYNLFGGRYQFWVKGCLDAVFITEGDPQPVGLIMPVRRKEEEK